MLKHPQITRDRAKQFLERELRARLVRDSRRVDGAEFAAGEWRDQGSADREGDWQPVAPGFRWGPAYRFGWYRLSVDVPAEWAGREVGLTYGEPRTDERGEMVEGTVWRDGRVVGAIDWAHPVHRLGDAGPFRLAVQTYARNAETALHGREAPRTPDPETFRGFWLVSVDAELQGLAYDFAFSLGLLEAVPETDPAHAHVLTALNEVCNRYRPGERKSLAAARRRLKETLGSLVGELNHTVYPVGHAHLDTAWLWPLAVTRLKMAHTTALQLDLMERYPEHVFVHSQASQYEWLEQEYPDLFDRVKRAVRKGQWEPVGSMWVEADCNLTGGEALVRQFLYGRRYFQRLFGVTTEDMWLPDVFGYSAALPQILGKFGIRYFLTQKLSWNQFNKIPHHTFWWQGIDGSRVWTHFPPADTYVGTCTPKELVESVRKFKDHGRSDLSLLPFGYGDGGGGPTERHLEFLRRARLAPGLPAVENRKRARDFFRDAYEASRDLQTWVGELYFELHRGTYTSQAANKRANRECEFLMRDAELLACFRDDYPHGYPAAELEALWKVVLLNQFHDIIPGSSVREVYEDSARDYAEVRARAGALVAESLTRIGCKLDTTGMTRPVALFQNATVPGQGEIPWGEGAVPTSLQIGDEVLPVQVVEAFGARSIVFSVPHDALGAIAVGDLADAPVFNRPRLKVGSRRLENGEWIVRFDNHGNITSLLSQDEEPIEFIAPGRLGNMFQLFDDRPLFWDAWDVEAYALETGRHLRTSESFEIVERGPVRVAAELVKRFGRSTVRQRISLGPTPGVRFDTEIDWQEDEKMLKVAFPLNVNAQRATFEIQFGHVERPTHRNTSWDMAKFEVCAQKWADLSEGGYGAALLNDGKYGHDVLADTLRLTLLRAPKSPDPTCDMGVHRFTYVLLPHYDQVVQSDVVAAAYALNAPLRHAFLSPDGGAEVGVDGEMPRFVACDDRNIVVEAVKKAEDSDRIVVRLYEAHNCRGRAALSCARPVERAWLADLNETATGPLEIVDGLVRFDYRPFEIVTLLLEV